MRGFGKKIVIAVILIQLISLPIFLIAAKKQQEVRSRAEEPQNQVALETVGMAQFESDAPAIDTSGTQALQATVPHQDNQVVNNPKIKREVYGFFWYPYINDGDLYLQYPYLKTLAYAGLTLGFDGSINKSNSNYKLWASDKVKKIMSNARASGVKIHPRIAVFNSGGNQVGDFLSSSQKRQNAVTSIVDQIKNGPNTIDGVNIDFEPVPSANRAQFTSFIKDLRTQIDKVNPKLEIVVDTFASTANSEAGFDLRELSKYVDGFFVMSFMLTNYGTAVQAGSSNSYQDLSSVADSYLKKVPADKIILGFPFYTGTWKTKDNTYRSKTTADQTGPGHAVLFDKAQREAKTYGLNYDDNQKTAWYTYYNCGLKSWRQVYFDNERAQTEKFAIANQKNLKGVGFWTFNQDRGFIDTWKAVYNAFGDKSALSVPTLKPGASEPGPLKADGACPPPTPTPTPSIRPSATPTRRPSPTPTIRITSTPNPTQTLTPTPTIVIEPNSTYLKLSVGLNGIGNTGTSSYPSVNSGNKNPIKTDADINLKIFAADNKLVKDLTGKIYYDKTAGKFTNTFKLDNNFGSGFYNLYISVPVYLTKRIDMNINKGVVNPVSPSNLTTGEVNGDLKRNILDWNLINSCSIYGNIKNPTLCPDNSAFMANADLDRNGRVEADDITLWIQEFVGDNSGVTIPPNGTPTPSIRPTVTPTRRPTPTPTRRPTPTPTKKPTPTPTKTYPQAKTRNLTYFILSDVTVCNISTTCYRLKLDDNEKEKIKNEAYKFRDKVNGWVGNKINLNIKFVEINTNQKISLEKISSNSWSATPVSLNKIIAPKIDKNTDFVTATLSFYDKSQNKSISHEGYCGLSYDGYYQWGTGYNFIPFTRDGCFTTDVMEHEWTHQVDIALDQLNGPQDLYNGTYPKSLCGKTKASDDFKWFPDPDQADRTPDFPACKNYYANWGAYCSSISPRDCDQEYREYSLKKHFPSNINFTGNSCRDGKKDFGETGIDRGGACK